jgi:hypothetical protein
MSTPYDPSDGAPPGPFSQPQSPPSWEGGPVVPPPAWGGAQPGPPGSTPPKRSWIVRHKVLTAVGAVLGLLAVAGGITLAASSGQGNEAACQKALTALMDKARAGDDLSSASQPTACKGIDEAALNRIANVVAGEAFTDVFKNFGATPTATGVPDDVGVPVESLPPTPPAYTATASDFTITLKVKARDCFGDAGCNVTYEPQLTIVGAQVDQDGSYSITYEVRGGTDGAQVDTLEVDGGQYTSSEGFAQTARASSKLTAVITDVETN